MRGLGKLLTRLVWVVVLCYAVPAFAIGAARAMRRIRHAEVLGLCKGGFGHTLTFPDCLRRAFPGRRTAAIFLSETERYNSGVSLLYPDCIVVIVEVKCAVRLFGRRIVAPYNWWLDRLFYPLLGWWSAKVQRRETYQLPSQWHSILPAPELAEMGGDHLKLAGDQHPVNAFPRYYVLRQRVAAPPARLPDAEARVVDAALQRLRPATRTCCLYLRQKEGDQPENVHRNGSTFADHLPAIEWLVARGYRVLVTGDHRLDPMVARRFDGMVVDHVAAGLDKGLFSLYAPTRADIWIGADGGGTSVPLVAEVPMLGINWFPYFAIFPGMALHYKYLVRPDGSLVPPSELFGRFAFDWQCVGHQMPDNTPEQIRDAVIDFVRRVEAGEPPGESPRRLGPTPEDVWFNIAPAWISAPWLEPFRAVLHADTRTAQDASARR